MGARPLPSRPWEPHIGSGLHSVSIYVCTGMGSRFAVWGRAGAESAIPPQGVHPHRRPPHALQPMPAVGRARRTPAPPNPTSHHAAALGTATRPSRGRAPPPPRPAPRRANHDEAKGKGHLPRPLLHTPPAHRIGSADLPPPPPPTTRAHSLLLQWRQPPARPPRRVG